MAATKKKVRPAPSAEDIAAQLQNTHAAVSAAIAAGYDKVEDAMKQAEDAVALAVGGVAEAMRLAQQATKE
ncbi:hypothetical protein [Lysobacter tyrosinilyticus]